MIGKTTISEAQLIGRGARYFPFVLPDQPDRFRRKFDEELNHELRVLEELHYHSIHDSRYISEIQTALIEQGMMDERMVTRELKQNILRSAIARNPFFTFASLKRYCPHLTSVREFMTSENYLGSLAITFKGNLARLEENRSAKLAACEGLLSQIETEIRQQITEYEGTKHFRPRQIHDIFKDKLLKFDARNPHATIDRQFEDQDWFPFNTLYGTSEEKAFVDLLIRKIKHLAIDYDDIYLLRNEGHFAIYNFSDGQAFYPDFALFLQEKKGKVVCFQFFVEPKGKFLQAHDQWKEDFMRDITTEFKDKLLTFESTKYRLIGLPFYNEENENPFWDALNTALLHSDPHNSIK